MTNALILSQVLGGEPVGLPMVDDSGPVILARVLCGLVDNVGIYLVSGTDAQLAALPGRAGIYAVGPGAWDTAMDAGTATIVNGLMVQGGYDPLLDGTDYLTGMRAVFGAQFDAALYACMETPTDAPRATRKRRKKQ
jgi:hypothetical protein